MESIYLKPQLVNTLIINQARTIQRYISGLNTFISGYEATEHLRIEYDRQINAFKMINIGNQNIDQKQVLAIIKMLMATRGLTKEEK